MDGEGKRFNNELADARHGYQHLNSVWRPTPQPIPVHLIFDENVRLAGPLKTSTVANWANIVDKNVWSPDNSEELKKGWILQADTIAELAEKIEVDPKNLEETVNKE